MKKSYLNTIIRVSKYTFLILFVNAFCASVLLATDMAKGQNLKDVRTDLEVENATLKKVFRLLEEGTSFEFSYATNNIPLNKKVSVQRKNENLYDILSELSQKADVEFKRVNGQIIVKQRRATDESIVMDQTLADVDISGKISDENGEGLPGASIVVQGTANGTTTNLDGNYKLSVPEGSTLVVSFVGYKQQMIVVGSQSSINIQMELDAEQLDEVVVLGYTTRKRGELTGSVSTINSEELQKTPNKDLAKSLSGRVAGLIVVDRGGLPGATDGMDLLIRGKSTMGNNSPLILIDGIPAASFSFLAPSDIESISVLKDGAAAIYGARAANGVIVVTTKRGRKGAPQISLSSQYTLSGLTARANMMSSEQFAIYHNEAAQRDGTALPYSTDDIARYAAGNDPLYPSTDWYDETVNETTPEWRHTMSVSGGSDNVSYFLSGDILEQQGAFKSGDVNFNQKQLRSNIDVNLTNFLKVGIDVSGRFGERNQPGVSFGHIYKHIYTNAPTEVAQYPNGLPAWGGEDGANPIVMTSTDAGFINTSDKNLRSRLSFELDLNQWVEGLSVQGYAGIRDWSTQTKSWYTPWTYYTYDNANDEYIAQTGNSQQGTTQVLRERFWQYNELMLNSTIRYDRTFGDHTVKGFVGIERFTSEQANVYAERRGFPSNDRPELFAGSDDGQISSGESAEWARLNYFGSLSYDYAKKYFVDLTLRHDGSSNFPAGKRFGTFPGVAVAWSIGDEEFMADAKPLFSSVKLRTSWAKMGNDRIPGFQFLTKYDYGGPENSAQPNYYFFGTDGARRLGFASAETPNPNITWETANMSNLGLNFTMFDYKLSADVNYFYQKREGILIQRDASIPDYVGLTLPDENLGKVDNYGWEFQLGWNDQIGDLTYNLGFNYTIAKNKIIFMDEAVDVPDRLKQEGFPMDSRVIYLTNGLFKSQEEVDAATVKLNGTVEGEPYYIDTNEDGEISAGDRVRRHSSPIPEVQYGITGGLSYKGFDFNFLFQGQAKADMLVTFDEFNRPEFIFKERWTPENRNARYPRAAITSNYSGNRSGDIGNPEMADLYYHSASFLRLKEVELGYTFDKAKVKVGSARVFLRGMNLLTMFSDVFSDFGLDPEAGDYNGFRFSTYTGLRSFSFGVNFNF
ncbi:MAG: SusC/RagA family TonB-linked outer membrane protein [Cyclobacteriaceae bacterium]